MKKSLVRNLFKANWLLTLAFVMLLATILFTYLDKTAEAIYALANGSISILAMSFMHVWIRLQIKSYKPDIAFRQHQVLVFSVTYIFVLSYSLLTSSAKYLFSDGTWHVPTDGQRTVTLIAGSLFLNTVIFVLHNSVITYYAKLDTEVENERLKAANSEANNLLLKQQIHPHFLFNSLNTIKSLYRRNSEDGDAYVVHMASFLRASLSSSSAKLVSLDDEVKLCDDYIAMQKIRFGDALLYQCHIDKEILENGWMPSFSLQPLIENAIKHNEATEQHPLFIKVSNDKDFVSVENNLQKRNKPVVSTGTGLLNLMKRYKLISGDEVMIKETGSSFSVSLKILST